MSACAKVCGSRDSVLISVEDGNRGATSWGGLAFYILGCACCTLLCCGHSIMMGTVSCAQLLWYLCPDICFVNVWLEATAQQC